MPVSYTHLDVYKRQAICITRHIYRGNQMRNFDERIRDEINKSVNNLEKDIARTYQKKCPKCGNICADKLKICPACSHTLEGVIRKYQLRCV